LALHDATREHARRGPHGARRHRRAGVFPPAHRRLRGGWPRAWTEGSLLILAGAGSGKTRVIAHRIAYLIAEKGVAPWNILAVTFTNKAAQEMRQRVQRLLRDEELRAARSSRRFTVSACASFVRTSKSLTTNTRAPSPSTIRTTRCGYQELHQGPGLRRKASRPARHAVRHQLGKEPRRRRRSFCRARRLRRRTRAAIARVYATYEERLHANNALDFDDLMIKTVRLLRKVPEVREKYNNKFRYILVDEYQDTNSLQFALISLLTEKQQNICVVGDEDQSIYKWRGADITNILNFEKHFPNTKTIGSNRTIARRRRFSTSPARS
jgi:DNA helicase-2/ATP-dependent DNA helicase PcrA